MSEAGSSPIDRLSEFLQERAEKRSHPLFLVVNDDFELIDARGAAEHYGFGPLKRGQDLAEKLLFLVGMQTKGASITTLPVLDMGNGVFAQVHAVRVRNGWGLAFSDTTEQTRLQHQYQQLAHDLALAQRELTKKHAELEKADRLKSQFIGHMSHEFRTPLSSVLGFASLAFEDLGDVNRLQHDLHAIQRGGNYLLSLVDNLLDQAVIENDRLLIRPVTCNVQRLLDEMEELFHPTARQKGLSLAWWVDSELPEGVWLDEIRLRQVLVNLIGNAIKYTRKGGITVSLNWDKEILEVTVEDTGTGIPAADLDKLFEPFNQGSGGNGVKPGAGLGLTISRSIVERMGGALTLESEMGKGTVAKFSVSAPARNKTGAASTPLNGLTILLLEDDPDTRELIRIFLQGAGVNLNVAQDEKECDILVSRKPDLILVHLLEEPQHRLLLSRLRKAGYQGPVVAVGSEDQEGLHLRILQEGYAALLTKPIRRSELIERLGDTLANPA